jgi:uncharacterized protein YbjT (DUF2867 family)
MTKLLVVGGTGGVGQLVVATLLQQGRSVRLLTRHPERARTLFADMTPDPAALELVVGDIRQSASLPAALDGVSEIICTAGSTAFPSDRWEFDLPNDGLAKIAAWGEIYLDSRKRATARNSPAQVDGVGVTNLVQAAPKDLRRFLLISSCGVERQQIFPYSVLNSFGVLTAKKQGEDALRAAGLPFTILRPGRLTDGPYTSRDLNSLIQAKTQGRLGVMIWTGDRLSGDSSRLDCLDLPATQNKIYELINQGSRPAQINWAELFQQAEQRG